MIALLLATHLAMAQQVQPEEILLVPAGSIVTISTGDFRTIPRKSFLLPESFYDSALIQAKQLAVCKPALDTCTTTTLDWQRRTVDALNVSENQFNADETLIADLTGQIRTMETRAITAESLLVDARKSKWVAWAVTGGLCLGAASVIVTSLVP